MGGEGVPTVLCIVLLLQSETTLKVDVTTHTLCLRPLNSVLLAVVVCGCLNWPFSILPTTPRTFMLLIYCLFITNLRQITYKNRPEERNEGFARARTHTHTHTH